MPKSLDDGESKIVPIKAPEHLRDSLKEVLLEGETISSVTRDLWQRLIKTRTKLSAAASAKRPRKS